MSATIIKSSNEIGHVLKEGRRKSSAFITIYSKKTPAQRDQSGRVAFIAAKKHGNAVWRNRSKRIMRAAFSELEQSFEGLDLVLVASKRLHEVNSRELAVEIRNLLP